MMWIIGSVVLVVTLLVLLVLLFGHLWIRRDKIEDDYRRFQHEHGLTEPTAEPPGVSLPPVTARCHTPLADPAETRKQPG